MTRERIAEIICENLADFKWDFAENPEHAIIISPKRKSDVARTADAILAELRRENAANLLVNIEALDHIESLLREMEMLQMRFSGTQGFDFGCESNDEYQAAKLFLDEAMKTNG